MAAHRSCGVISPKVGGSSYDCGHLSVAGGEAAFSLLNSKLG